MLLTVLLICWYAGRKSAVVINPLLCAPRPRTAFDILHMEDLADVVSAHDVKHHADDTHLYLRCHAHEATTAAHRLKVCITDLQRWMEGNRLKLNTDKTELL